VSSNPVNIKPRSTISNLSKIQPEKFDKPIPGMKMAKRCADHGEVIDDYAQAWCRLRDDPFEAKTEFEGETIKVPMADGEIPCRSTDVVRGSRIEFALSTDGFANFWFIPDGVFNFAEGEYQVKLATLTSSTANFGPVGDGGNKASYGYYTTNATYDAAPGIMTFHANASLSAGFNHLEWNTQDCNTPFNFPTGNHPGMKYRCTAFGVQISYTGEADAAQGSVIFSQLYDMPTTGVPIMRSRSTKGYKEVFMNQRKTAKCAYKANCDVGKWTENYNGNITNQPGCRFAACVSGASGGTYVIEAIGVYSLVKPSVLSEDTDGYITPDVVHLKNAIVSSFDSESKLIHHAVHHKMKSHPILKKILKLGAAGIKNFGGLGEIAKLVGFA
jgi:hypothetical protein